MKTGECNFRDEDGKLWLAESFVDEDGLTSTENTLQVVDPISCPITPAAS